MTPHSLNYRFQVKLGGYLLLGFSILCFIASAFFLIVAFLGKDSIFFSCLTGIVGLFEFTIYYFFLRPKMITKIYVLDDKFVIRRNKKNRFIHYAKILRIEGASGKKQGAFFKIVTQKKTYEFSSILENCDEVLSAIYSARPDLLSKVEFENLRKNLILSSHSMDRYYELYRSQNLRWNIIHALGFTLTAGILLYMFQSSDYQIHSRVIYGAELLYDFFILIGFLQGLFILLVDKPIKEEESARFESDPQDRKRNRNFEVQVYKKWIPAYLVILTLSLGYYGFSEFNLRSSIVAETTDGWIGLKIGKTYEVDEKFNCTTCRHKLALNDVVLLNNGRVVEIKALPTQGIELKKYSQNTRAIASLGKTIVPEDQVAVSQKEGREVTLVQQSSITGKVIK